jgi:hypothetical protein
MSKSAQLQRASEEAKQTSEQRLQMEMRAAETARDELRVLSVEMEKMDKVELINSF